MSQSIVVYNGFCYNEKILITLPHIFNFVYNGFLFPT